MTQYCTDNILYTYSTCFIYEIFVSQVQCGSLSSFHNFIRTDIIVKSVVGQKLAVVYEIN